MMALGRATGSVAAAAGGAVFVFGGGAAPQQVEVDHNEIYHALRNEAFHSSVLSMVLDGATQACYSGPPATRGVGACADGGSA